MERTLTQLPFWSSLTEREMDTLRRSAFVRHYKKGAFVHSSDNECLGMLFILSGEIRTYLLSDEGREVTLFRLYQGELCVLSASCVISQITFDTRMTAGMDTDILIISANVIAALKEKNLHVRCFLYELATKRFSDVMWAMQHGAVLRAHWIEMILLVRDAHHLLKIRGIRSHIHKRKLKADTQRAVPPASDNLLGTPAGACRILRQKEEHFRMSHTGAGFPSSLFY